MHHPYASGFISQSSLTVTIRSFSIASSIFETQNAVHHGRLVEYEGMRARESSAYPDDSWLCAVSVSHNGKGRNMGTCLGVIQIKPSPQSLCAMEMSCVILKDTSHVRSWIKEMDLE
ncbi:hypothetical protein Trydic_g16663 [Trypoxylus dichotomus]